MLNAKLTMNEPEHMKVTGHTRRAPEVLWNIRLVFCQRETNKHNTLNDLKAES